MTGIGRILVGVLEFVVAFVSTYAVIVVVGQGIAINKTPTSGSVELFIRSNGVHTELSMPSESEVFCWTDFLPLDAYEEVPSFQYVAIGWGDKGFFLDTPTWAELKVSTAVNAVFMPSSSAMHVTYEALPQESELCKRIVISENQYKLLIRYIIGSFKLSEGKTILIQGKGYSTNDNFYEARGSYHLFNTCNTWTNDALKSASLPTALYATLPDGIMNNI